MQHVRRTLSRSHALLITLVLIIVTVAGGITASRQQLLDDQNDLSSTVVSMTPDSCKWCGGE